MAYTIGNLTTNTVSTGADCTISKPSSLAVGDLMFAHCVWYNYTGVTTITLPSGWTQAEFTSQGAAGPAMVTAYKLATSSDVAATNFTFSANGSGTRVNLGNIFTIRGAKESNPGYAKNEASSAGTASLTISSITPTVASSLLLFFTAGGRSASPAMTFTSHACATSNPTWTELYDTGANSGSDYVSICLAYATRPETTGTGNLTVTPSSASDGVVGHVLALEPGIEFSTSETVTMTDSTPLLSLSVRVADTVTPSDTQETEDALAISGDTRDLSAWVNEPK